MKYAKLLAIAVFLFAPTASAFADAAGQKMAALYSATQNQNDGPVDWTLMVIPAADNFISNKLVVASLKSGTDTKVSQGISGMLLQQAPLQLAITSDNDGVGAATLERALLNLKGRAVASHQLAFIGGKKYQDSLTKTAADVGLKLVYVVYP